MRYCIGLVTAAALLAPVSAVFSAAASGFGTEQSRETGEGEGALTLYLTYKLDQAADEAEKRLEREFSLSSGTLQLSLIPDASDPSAVRLTGARLGFTGKADRFVREAVAKRAEELLECPVRVEREGE